MPTIFLIENTKLRASLTRCPAATRHHLSPKVKVVRQRAVDAQAMVACRFRASWTASSDRRRHTVALGQCDCDITGLLVLKMLRRLHIEKPYIRATCNPDADSWVAEFIAWWIDQETGLPIPERAGVVRYFIRINDALIWGNSLEELREKYGADVLPKSVTFIPAKLTDNPALMAADPGYLANLVIEKLGLWDCSRAL